jgi:hypothetical protein
MITFVAAAYKETTDAYMFLSSLIIQTNQRWKCIVYADAPNNYIKTAIETLNDSRISYVENKTSTGFWGHYNRKKALYELVGTEFVINTSIQDYYTPNAVAEILNYQDHDFIFFNCVHCHYQHHILQSEPKRGHIDWGSFAVKTSIAKQVGIREPESSMCDGIFVENCFARGNLKATKIGKILTVHN